jgi:hypothetical protein
MGAWSMGHGAWERGNVGTWERGNVGAWERGNVGVEVPGAAVLGAEFSAACWVPED